MTTDLITKYRPRTFKEVYGHEVQIQALEKALASRRAHTFLLTGPSGVGKTTIARIIANKLNCNPSYIFEVDAASNTGIDAMRNIAEVMRYQPIGDQGQAAIVDEVHALSRQAFQSLLKALEEPLERCYWLLCTTEPSKIPATIKTRCLHISLGPLSKSTLVEMLTDIAEREGFKGKKLKEIIDVCAEKAEGSPRQALSNFALAADAKNTDEASLLIDNTSEESNAAIDLARAIMRHGVKWRDLQPILKGLKDQNAESIRHVVRAYATTTALNSNGTNYHALNVLEAFSQPYYPPDGISPLILSCAKVVCERM